MKKNVVLMRVSTDMQETISQKTAIEKYVINNQIIVDEWIEEQGVSGFKTKLEDRKGLMQIQDMAMNNELERVIVFNSDRIGRRMEMVGFVNLLDECGVQVISVLEGLLNEGKDTDDLLNSIKFWMNQQESKKISKRVSAGKTAGYQAGKFNGGKINYGYKVVDKKLVRDEKESEIVKFIFDSYIDVGNTKTVVLLNKRKIKKRGEDWNEKKLIKLLKNSIYIGQKKYDGSNKTQPYDENMRIVDDEIFYKAQALITERRTSLKEDRAKFRNRTPALLEGILYHVCGDGKVRKLYIDYSNYKGKKSLIYRCSYCKLHRHKFETQKSYTGSKINICVEDSILEIMDNLSVEKLEKQYNETNPQKIEELNLAISNIEKTIKKKHKALANAQNELELIFQGESEMDKKTVNSMIIKIRAEIEDLNIKLEETKLDLDKNSRVYKNIEKLVEKYKDFNYLYRIADLMEKKTILQELIDKVVIDKNKIDIKLNIW